MRRIASVILVALCLLAIPTLTYAQAKEGDKEVQVSGNTFTLLSPSGSSTFGQFQLGLGYFVTDRFEVGVTPIVTVTVAAGNSTADLGLATKVQYFFGEKASKVKPYIGGAFIVESFKTTGAGSISDNIYTGGNVGVKNYFTEHAALDMNASFGVNPSNAGSAQLIQFNIGISYVF